MTLQRSPEVERFSVVLWRQQKTLGINGVRPRRPRTSPHSDDLHTRRAVDFARGERNALIGLRKDDLARRLQERFAGDGTNN
jgi:hypothetical protein